MSLPIKPTEDLEGEEAETFFKRMKEVEANPGQDKIEFEDPRSTEDHICKAPPEVWNCMSDCEDCGFAVKRNKT
jgi:hypothetical protein